MSKLLLLIYINLLAFFAFSQHPSDLTGKELKGYKVQRIVTVHHVDSETIMIAAYVEENFSSYPMLFKVKHAAETESYSVEKLDLTPKEVYRNLSGAYCRIGTTIYRCRQEVVNQESFFYMDELVGNRFKNASESFFKDFADNGYALGIELFPTDYSLIMTTQNKSETAISKFSVAEFKTGDMQRISWGEVMIPKSHNVSSIQTFMYENNLIASYKFKEFGSSKIKILFAGTKNPDKKKLAEMNYETELDLDIQNFAIHSDQKSSYLSVLYKDKSFLFDLHLVAIDLDNSSLSIVNDYKVPVSILNNNYLVKPDEPGMKPELRQREFRTSQPEKDKNGDQYIFYYGANSLKATRFLEYNDILVVKISGDQIVWSQLIRRGTRTARYRSVFPKITILENEIMFIDYEWTNFFRKGEYIPQLKQVHFKGLFNVSDVRILLNKESGEISRKLMETPVK